MNKRYFLIATVILSLLPGCWLFSAETNAASESTAPAASNEAANPVYDDLKDLISRINDKISHDKTNETDLADNFKEFDALVAKHKEASADDRAQILIMKAKLFLQVLGRPEKALEVFEQIKSTFPTVQINGNTDKVIKTFQTVIALAPGAPFPDFNETDVEGKPLSISQFKGKVVLVDFWATWCPPCIMELPTIQKAYDKYHGQGFEVVGISLDEEKDRLQQFVKQKKMSWPEYFDGKRWDNKLAVKYGIDSTPTGYLIGRDGKIIAKLSDADELESQVAEALKK